MVMEEGTRANGISRSRHKMDKGKWKTWEWRRHKRNYFSQKTLNLCLC